MRYEGVPPITRSGPRSGLSGPRAGWQPGLVKGRGDVITEQEQEKRAELLVLDFN